MTLKNFWGEWSGNFPITLTYKEPNEILGTPEVVEVERAGQKVLLTKEDVQIAAMLFSKNPEDRWLKEPVDAEAFEQPLDGPHSRACGFAKHDHGSACSDNCPTCHGRDLLDDIGLKGGAPQW